jgi:chemosensory pili system protein ChpC
MGAYNDKVRSLWVPLRDANLLVPNVAVSEIISYRVPSPLPGMPEWCLGTVKWSGEDIPVVSVEAVCGLSSQSNPVFSRLMVVNSVRPDSTVHHYAIVTAGLPGLIQFGPDTADQVAPCANDGLKCIVRIGNEEAIIPDLDYLQGLLEIEFANAA